MSDNVESCQWCLEVIEPSDRRATVINGDAMHASCAQDALFAEVEAGEETS